MALQIKQQTRRLFKAFLRQPSSKAVLLRTIPTTVRLQTQIAAFHHSQTTKMNIARVTAWGKPPQYMSGPALPPPSPSQLQLKVLAVGVPRVVWQARATGKHGSTMGATLPFDPSIDGVGLDETTNDIYYIAPAAASLFSERANVERTHLVKIAPGADPISIAGLINPVSSSWMALRSRALGGCQGRTVFIVGANSTSGRLAVNVARELGAAKIVGASRSEDTLAAVEGLDERVLLREPFALPESVGPVHIVLDYVGGSSAVELMKAVQIEPGNDLQYIHVGGLGGEDNVFLPVRLLSGKQIRITGSGKGSWAMSDMKKEIPGLINAVSKIKRPDSIWHAPLADIESVWDDEDTKNKRLVLIP